MPITDPPVDNGSEAATQPNQAVRNAVRALHDFGGLGLSRASARRILPLWASYGGLTSREIFDVYLYFPAHDPAHSEPKR